MHEAATKMPEHCLTCGSSQVSSVSILCVDFRVEHQHTEDRLMHLERNQHSNDDNGGGVAERCSRFL